MSGPWLRHELSPWERQRGNSAEYGLHLHDASKLDGGDQWIQVRRSQVRLEETGRFVVRWVAMWAPAGFRGVHPHIVVLLFATRTLAAAKRLVDVWAAAREVTS